ncbi:MAG: ATP-binding cassette domain-containing protein [Desulfuromonadales bacterium]
MISVEGMNFSYGRTPVLQEIDFRVEQGEILGIIGPNGSGKSTLLRLLRGLLTPAEGRILWDARSAHRISRRDMARRAAVVPQSTSASFPFTVRTMVAMGRYARGGSEAGSRKAVERALALADISHLAERSVTTLSGGELQRVYLGRALAQETPVLLLDEATSHLDLDHRIEINHVLRRLNDKSGTTVVQVSHDLDSAAESCHRLLLLDRKGRMAAIGTPQEVLTPQRLRQIFQVEIRVEPNPYTGAPRILPVPPSPAWGEEGPRVHIFCGGGSGGELLRILHLAGCRLSAGPLNRGDSDLALCEALGIPVVREKPFAPLSEHALAEAEEISVKADLVVIAAVPWGSGNLAVLHSALNCRNSGSPLLLVDPRQENDYTGGSAWSLIQKLQEADAILVATPREVLDKLKGSRR